MRKNNVIYFKAVLFVISFIFLSFSIFKRANIKNSLTIKKKFFLIFLKKKLEKSNFVPKFKKHLIFFFYYFSYLFFYNLIFGKKVKKQKENKRAFQVFSFLSVLLVYKVCIYFITYLKKKYIRSLVKRMVVS
jgi:hypothetical protein